MKKIVAEIRTAVIMTLITGLICCGVYPALVWGLAQGLFNDKANGSLIIMDSKIAGSRLLGREFSGNEYFHPRPSAAGTGYDAACSGGSNLGPLSKRLYDSVKQRADAYRRINGLAPNEAVPVDAVTASASGLDPHIGTQNALIQAKRVARERSLSEETVIRLVEHNKSGRQLGVFGEPRVNVLMLNLELDRQGKRDGSKQG
jgi:potassium-transporting ATPase KdpC subunit